MYSAQIDWGGCKNKVYKSSVRLYPTIEALLTEAEARNSRGMNIRISEIQEDGSFNKYASCGFDEDGNLRRWVTKTVNGRRIKVLASTIAFDKDA